MNVTLKEKEKTAVKDLQTQEKSCMEKYRRYEQEAKDPVLKDLFHQLHLKEKKHYDSLDQLLSGNCPECDCQ